KLEQLGYTFRNVDNDRFNQFVQDRIDGKTTQSFSEWRQSRKPFESPADRLAAATQTPEQQEAAIAEQKAKVAKGKQPWQMTANEWNTEFNKLKPSSSGSHS